MLPAFIGSLSVAFYTQAKTMGLDKQMKMFSSSASLESIDPGDIQGAAEGVYFFENFPRMLAHKNDEYHKEFNKLIGIDDVYCREIGGTRVMDKSHGWQAWEDIFAIKTAVETSGYKTRKDIEGAIQALEGMQMKNSLGHPQGDKIIRKEDHAGIIDCYISRVENGKFEVKRRIPKEDLAKNMPLRHNLSDDAGVTGLMRRRTMAPPSPLPRPRRHDPVSEGQGLRGACRACLPRRQKTVAKAVSLIAEAAAAGARLIAFPESFVPGFPLWASVQAPIKNHEYFKTFAANSIGVPGPEMQQLCEAAREHRIFVSIGISERSPASVGCLWNSNLLIGADGTILTHHRKLVPTFYEKLIWANGDGEGLVVRDTEIGKLGMLICGENTNPLARYSLIAQGEQIHVSSYPPVWPTRPSNEPGRYDLASAIRISAGAHSFEGKVFNIVSSAFLDKSTLEALRGLDREALATMEQSPRGRVDGGGTVRRGHQ